MESGSRAPPNITGGMGITGPFGGHAPSYQNQQMGGQPPSMHGQANAYMPPPGYGYPPIATNQYGGVSGPYGGPGAMQPNQMPPPGLD